MRQKRAALAWLEWWLGGGFGALVAIVLLVGYGWRPMPLLAVAAAVALLALLVPHVPQLAQLVNVDIVILGLRSGDDAQD